MAEKDIIMMRQRELKRLHVIHKVIEGELTQVAASELISLSERQIRRIVRRIQQEGDGGILHKSRGCRSTREIPKKLRERIVDLYRQKYQGFGPTLAAEKLFEIDSIKVSKETVRTLLINSGEWQKGRKHRPHRQWRQRKEHKGELVQMDGSHHAWFEERGPKCVLMAYIDDAPGRVYGRFYEYEGTIPAMDSFKRYTRRFGIPMKLYLDRHTTYKSAVRPTMQEQIQGIEHTSQFERAMKELGVAVVHAFSPQAKGRIERLFGTLQDRLVKEMRLRAISTIEDANRFLTEYLSVYNKKFMVEPAAKDDMHRLITKESDLDKILCIKTERTVKNDNTIAHDGQLYQIEERVSSKKVIVEEKINGKILIVCEGKSLRYRLINERPIPIKKQPVVKKKRTPYIIPKDHAWRKFDVNGFKKRKPQWAVAQSRTSFSFCQKPDISILP